MAGRPGRSGGARPNSGPKPKGEPVPPRGLTLREFTRKEPKLLATEDSINAHARWLSEQLLHGTVDPIIAREVKEQHRTMLRALGQKHTKTELSEMRRLVAAAQQAAEMTKRNEGDNRFSQDESLVRERPAPECAPPEPFTSSGSASSAEPTPPTATPL